MLADSDNRKCLCHAGFCCRRHLKEPMPAIFLICLFNQVDDDYIIWDGLITPYDSNRQRKRGSNRFITSFAVNTAQLSSKHLEWTELTVLPLLFTPALGKIKHNAWHSYITSLESRKVHGRVFCKLKFKRLITEITRMVKEYSATKPASLSTLTRTQEMTWES